MKSGRRSKGNFEHSINARDEQYQVISIYPFDIALCHVMLSAETS